MIYTVLQPSTLSFTPPRSALQPSTLSFTPPRSALQPSTLSFAPPRSALQPSTLSFTPPRSALQSNTLSFTPPGLCIFSLIILVIIEVYYHCVDTRGWGWYPFYWTISTGTCFYQRTFTIHTTRNNIDTLCDTSACDY